jgi:RNA polymerase subunit RPABC4/transcription elongation factor Spt4
VAQTSVCEVEIREPSIRCNRFSYAEPQTEVCATNTMHCPQCGTIATPGQQYCRSCGLSLEKVAELIGAALTVETGDDEIARLKELQRKHENWGGIAGMVAFGLVIALFVFLVVSQIMMKGGLLILLGSLLILLAIGALTMVYFHASAKSLKEKLAEKKLSPASTQPATEMTDRRPLISITENTTELLSASKAPSTRDLTS